MHRLHNAEKWAEKSEEGRKEKKVQDCLFLLREKGARAEKQKRK